eukprot:TRINITY_DN300_c0_g1_i1.p1 TRINITY_DN300_c0_g1~~TRINITY_DN300_c0_g1_i1.p1  ORF type:complete len:299 (+),score=19.05 TRINITY_DN300_c0_g1_i1:3-899(+)
MTFCKFQYFVNHLDKNNNQLWQGQRDLNPYSYQANGFSLKRVDFFFTLDFLLFAEPFFGVKQIEKKSKQNVGKVAKPPWGQPQHRGSKPPGRREGGNGFLGQSPSIPSSTCVHFAFRSTPSSKRNNPFMRSNPPKEGFGGSGRIECDGLQPKVALREARGTRQRKLFQLLMAPPWAKARRPLDATFALLLRFSTFASPEGGFYVSTLAKRKLRGQTPLNFFLRNKDNVRVVLFKSLLHLIFFINQIQNFQLKNPITVIRTLIGSCWFLQHYLALQTKKNLRSKLLHLFLKPAKQIVQF